MVAATTEGRKYIVGWLTFPPGTRDDFMRDVVLPYTAACRAEEGCVFFEMNPSATDPDVITFAECFESAEAHAVHHQTPWFETMWRELNQHCRQGRFENIFPGRVEPESVDFKPAP